MAQDKRVGTTRLPLETHGSTWSALGHHHNMLAEGAHGEVITNDRQVANKVETELIRARTFV